MVIFTDLDGTLLDHETYSWAPAKPALEAIKSANIPLVLASSKTAAEIAPIRADIGFEHCPAIVENGAGILPASADRDNAPSDDYDKIRKALSKVTADLREHFRGFGDMSSEDVANVTGLKLADAHHAKQRAFSEPGLWSGDEAQRESFCMALVDFGIRARFGGRFLTLSLGGTKASRMAEVLQILGEQHAQTVALGDAPNDVEMLETADRAFIIANPHGTQIPRLKGEDDGTVTRTKAIGPAGWNEAVLSVLS
ncbi:MAG: HAD-IIB family hydrolase [Pseudomonadota bacterium]